MNEKITAYIAAAPEELQKIMNSIRSIIHEEVPNVIENFKWSRPVFSTTSDFVYFKAARGYMTFGVFNFENIKNDQHLIEGTGKTMRHAKIRKLEDMDPEVIRQWVRAISK